MKDYARIIGASMVFCLALIVAAIIMGILGERDGLYLAYGGLIGLAMTVISCGLNHLANQYLARPRKKK